jgi:hypothetical protein
VAVAQDTLLAQSNKGERLVEATIDSLISKLVRSMDPAARRADFNQVQQIWGEQMPAIPTIAPNILVGWSNKLAICALDPGAASYLECRGDHKRNRDARGSIQTRPPRKADPLTCERLSSF